MQPATQKVPGAGRVWPIRKRLVLLGLGAVAVIVLLVWRSPKRIAACGFGATYAEGTIVSLPPTVMTVPNPHSALPDYKQGHTPVVRLDSENGRETRADVEDAHLERQIGDRVQVCYDPKQPGIVHIVRSIQKTK